MKADKQKQKHQKHLKKKRTHTYRKKRKEREIDKQRVDNLKQLSDVKKSCFFALLLTRNLPLTRTRKRLAPAVLFFVHKVKVKRTNKQKRKSGGINKQQQYCKESEALIPASNTKKDKGKGEKNWELNRKTKSEEQLFHLKNNSSFHLKKKEKRRRKQKKVKGNKHK